MQKFRVIESDKSGVNQTVVCLTVALFLNYIIDLQMQRNEVSKEIKVSDTDMI